MLGNSNLGHPFILSPDCSSIFKLRKTKNDLDAGINMTFSRAENIYPYTCYEIWVHALSEDQGGCSSTLGDSSHKGDL